MSGRYRNPDGRPAADLDVEESRTASQGAIINICTLLKEEVGFGSREGVWGETKSRMRPLGQPRAPSLMMEQLLAITSAKRAKMYSIFTCFRSHKEAATRGGTLFPERVRDTPHPQDLKSLSCYS